MLFRSYISNSTSPASFNYSIEDSTGLTSTAVVQLRSADAIDESTNSGNNGGSHMNINGLPTEGRCTAANFGRSNGNAAVLPSSSIQTSIRLTSGNGGSDYASLIFNGVKSLFEDGNFNELSGANSKRAFITLYRCAENGTGSYWELITPTTGDLSSIRRNVVEKIGRAHV